MVLSVRQWLGLGLLLIGAVLIISPRITGAQAQDSCPVLVQTALDHMGDNCGELGRNNACYGYTRVDSTFAETTPLDFFSRPSDRAGLAQIETINTTPLDLSLEQWGIAVMNVQANVPGALPGQSIVFMMMGDTEVTNAVAPDDVLPEVTPVEVKTLAETRLRGAPADTANTVTILDSGAALEAQGLTADQDWLRVYADVGLGWVKSSAVEEAAGLGDLPTVSSTSQTPMQTFQVNTAFNDLLCNEAPSLLAIQSPQHLKVDLTANGVHVRMGSLIMLRTLPPGDVLQVITIEGDVTLDPDTSFETDLQPGYATQRCLDDQGLISPDCEWSTPVPMTEDELAFAQTVLLAYEKLNPEGGSLDGSLAVGDNQVTLINTESCPAGATVEHTVRRGDTLFGLSLKYNTTVSAIIFGNDLAGTIIVPGQKLKVICGAQGPTTLPALGAPPVIVEEPGPPPPVNDCSGFEATSPLDGLKYGSNTFYWNAPNMHVDAYRVTVTGDNGSASFTTGGDNLSLTADLTYDTVGSGYTFSWAVEALVSGESVCSVPSVHINRESPPPFSNEDHDSGPSMEPTPQRTEEPPVDECQPICDGEFCYNPCEVDA